MHWGTAVVVFLVGVAAAVDRAAHDRESLALSWPLYGVLLAVVLAVVAIW
jgi:hypothetical protein